jgi:hypothetical protein
MQGQSGQLEVVSFHAGGVRFLVEASQVRSMQDLPPPAGKAISAAMLIGLAADGAGDKWLQIGQHPRLLEVSAPVELYALAPAAIHPLPPLVAAGMKLQGVRALALDERGTCLFIDVRALLPMV